MCFQSIDQQINCKGDCLNDRQRTHGDETALTFGEGEDAIVFGTYDDEFVNESIKDNSQKKAVMLKSEDSQKERNRLLRDKDLGEDGRRVSSPIKVSPERRAYLTSSQSYGELLVGASETITKWCVCCLYVQVRDGPCCQHHLLRDLEIRGSFIGLILHQRAVP